MRETLPTRRGHTTVTLRWLGKDYDVSCGHYLDGRPAEIFVHSTKAGSDVQIVANDAAILMSLALQYGAPLQTIRSAMAREENGNAQSIIGQVADVFVRLQEQAQ